jgi:hypothetical protein
MTIGEERMMYAVTALPKRIEEATDQLKRIADALERIASSRIVVEEADSVKLKVTPSEFDIKLPDYSTSKVED